MNAVHFQSLTMLVLLWSMPVLIFFYIYAAYRRKNALDNFVDSQIVARLSRSVDRSRRTWKIILTVTAYSLIIIALTRPAWNPKPQTVVRQGRDVVFVLDVSRSMLAEDLAPNRLERAKISINDAVERLQGDRVALVAFAGTSAVKCPLTLDYGFFRSMLSRVTVDSISRGGTLIGDAVRRVLDDVFADEEKRFKDIVLITDGEDQDSFPVDAARQAGERGIRIIAIGLGDEQMGSRIPVTDEEGRKVFLTYQGQEVWTKLDADTLRQMANATPGGRYINVATGTLDLGEIYIKLVAGAEQKALEAQTLQRYDEKFQIFIALALLLLLAEVAITERRRRESVAQRYENDHTE